MPVYNETLYELRKSIKSILNQNFPYFELIIVDDNPKSKCIKKYLITMSNKNRRIKVFFNSKNKGAIFSANKAINHSTGDFIARMDADDIAYPDRLSKQLHFCLCNNIDFLSCNYLNMNNNVVDNTNVYCETSIIDQSQMKRIMSFINIATGSTLFFKRSIANMIGQYRDMLVEDYDLAARFYIYGYRVGYLSDPLIYKRYRTNSLSGINSLKEFVILKSISKYLRKYNFTKVIPLSYVHSDLKKIRVKDIKKYNKFLKISKYYKENKTLFNLIKRYLWACSSPLIFKRNVFMHLYKDIQNLLLIL